MTVIKKDPRVHIIIKKDAVSRGTQPTDLAPKRMRDNSGAYVKRIKAKGEVGSAYRDIWTDGTYDGADLRPFEGRPGSMVAYSLPSRGVRT